MLRRLFSDQRGQAMTEYVILTLFVTVVCLFLLDPNDTLTWSEDLGSNVKFNIYTGLRAMYNFIGHALFMPGP